VDLRAFVVLSLLLCVIAPAYDHHAAERDPWHGHLVGHGSQPAAAHSHGSVHGHAQAQPDGIVITDGGPSEALGISAAGTSSLTPDVATASTGTAFLLSVPSLMGLTSIPLPGADPPPRATF
jgi:hypothetical protein